ncbi:MAG: sigma-70 family RNA polymerase sigma factor [Candidatus Omnitrophota bacterium]
MDDLRFVQACVSGDKKSWNEFLLRYSRLIYNYIYSVLHIKGFTFAAEQVEDVFQELFYSLIKDNCRKLSTYRGRNGCTLASWLRQVAINFTIDYLRKLKPALSIDAEREGGLVFKDALVDVSADTEKLLNDSDRRQALSDCIGFLSSSEQYFLELFLNQGLNLEQIRECLKINRGAVDMRKVRIFRKLQDCFSRKGFQLDSLR